MGKFVISNRKNGEYQFNLKAGNGQVILVSEGYSTKAACENGIDSVKRNAPDDDRYDRKEHQMVKNSSTSKQVMVKLSVAAKCTKAFQPEKTASSR